MLTIVRMPLVAAGFAMVVATIAIAQDNSSSTTPSSGQPSTQSSDAQAGTPAAQPSATNPTNTPTSEPGQTQQQAAAPVVDPEASAQKAAGEKAAAAQPGGAASANAQNAPQRDWPAPQRYETGRGASGSAPRQGGASLGINVFTTEDGQGLVVARVRPGTPADQMGLQPRDRILSLNDQPVVSVDEFIGAIRGMNAGDEVRLSIDRNGSPRDIRGRLAALRETVAAGEGPVGNIVGRARDFIGGGGENMAASYEERSQTGTRNSAGIEARLSRLEQQIERLTQEVQQLRSNASATQATGPQPGGANPQPATR